MIKTAVIGYGNVGKAAVEAVLRCQISSCSGYRRSGGLSGLPRWRSGWSLPEDQQQFGLQLPDGAGGGGEAAAQGHRHS